MFDWPVWILISVNWPQREMKAQGECVYVCIDKYAPLFSFSPLAMVVLYSCVPSQGCIGTQVDLGTARSCTFSLSYTNEIHWVSSSPPQPGQRMYYYYYTSVLL